MKCNEQNYIKRLKRKKEDGLEFAIDRHLGLVKGCVYKVLEPIGQQEAIDECINDVFFAIWNNSDQFDGSEEEFRKWIYKIAKYKSIDYYRKLVKRDEVEFEEAHSESVTSTETLIMAKEDEKEILALMEYLEPMDRKIFTMKYFLGNKSEEIGKVLGLTRSAVDNRVYRGKKKLHDLIGNLGAIN